MLGRSANDLFWMSRYMERAENIARLLEVGYRIALLPRDGDGQDNEWYSTLRSAGSEKGYLSKYGAYDTRDVVNHVLAGELKGTVWASLNELSREDREVLVLHGIEGRPHKEVGARIGLTPQHAAVRYQRAIKRLREQIPASVFEELADAG